MKTTYIVIIIIIIILISSLVIYKYKNKKRDTSVLRVGGLYTSKAKNGTYGVTKILALDDITVHIRQYSTTFNTKPTAISSSELNFFIGHMPIAKTSFRLDKQKLLKVEKVQESELEGYNYYLNATKLK